MTAAAPFAVRTLANANATTRLGQSLAPQLGAGDVLLLQGEIGAGKSHLARAILQTLMERAGVVEDVPSPTFTLVQTYEICKLDALHADLYRLTDIGDVAELGLLDAFHTCLTLVEWPDRLGALAPQSALWVTLTLHGDGRQATFAEYGTRWAQRLELPDEF